jgi:hypothetical protein
MFREHFSILTAFGPDCGNNRALHGGGIVPFPGASIRPGGGHAATKSSSDRLAKLLQQLEFNVRSIRNRAVDGRTDGLRPE